MIEPLAAIQSLAEMQMLATGGKHTDDHTYKSALDAYSLASTSHLQPHIDQNLCLGPVEAKLYDYRDEKVAGFDMSGQVMICLPQVFELFLKKYVGGMHTVYTKLKRLNIEPLICNVEQVRALRSLGAIQPGVNRCKLINRDDFDKLYDDCTNACARPGRPPKRSPHEDWSHIAKKEPRYDSSFDHHSFTSPQPSLSTESMTSPPPPPTGANPMQLFGNLFSFGAPQLLMQQMMAAVAQQQPQPRQNPFSNDSSTFLPQTQTIIDETLDEDEGEEEEGDDDPHSSMSSTLEDNKSDDRPSSSRATAGDLSRRTTSNESNESTSNQSGVALNLITKSDESPSTKFISPRDESERTSSDRSVPLNDTESSSSSTQQMRSSGAQSAQSDTDQTLQFVLARIGNMVDLANRTFSSHHQNIIAEKNATTMLHEKLISIVDRLNEQENRLERRLDEEQRKSRSYLMRYCSARREASSLRLQVSSLKRQLASNRQQHA